MVDPFKMVLPQAVVQAFRPDRPAVGFKVMPQFAYAIRVFPDLICRDKSRIRDGAARLEAVIHSPLLAVVWIFKVRIKGPCEVKRGLGHHLPTPEK